MVYLPDGETPLANEDGSLNIGGSGTSVELDDSLTYQGKAADAKATGDALGALSQQIDNEYLKKQQCGFVTPQMYGAVGDGIADDSAAIASAFNSDIKHVHFPKGIYKCNGFTFNNADHVGLNVTGMGIESRILLTAPFTFADGGIYHIKFSNFSTQSVSHNHAHFNLDKCLNCELRDITMFGANSEGALLVISESHENHEVVVDSCYIDTWGLEGMYGIYYGAGGGDFELNDTIIQGRGTLQRCVRFKDTGSTHVSGCHFYGAATGGYVVNITAPTSMISFSSCFIDSYNNDSRLVHIENAPNGGVNFNGCSFFISDTCGGGISFHEARKHIIANCVFVGSNPPTAAIFGNAEGDSAYINCVSMPDYWTNKVVNITRISPETC